MPPTLPLFRGSIVVANSSTRERERGGGEREREGGREREREGEVGDGWERWGVRILLNTQ